MVTKKGNLLYGQSGGPTAVINASAYGVISKALSVPNLIGEVFCMHYGIQGAINDDLIPVRELSIERIELLKQTPGAAFGSARHKLADFQKDESEYLKILNTLKKHDIRYLILNGGNDSMDTCHQIGEYLKWKGYDCAVIGIPKTVDNDLLFTDHCPGFGSAAKFVANTITEIAIDCEAYTKGRVTVVEIMGRNAGWLTASSSLASTTGHGPDLIYLPEVPFSMDRFVEDAKAIFARKKRCLVAVSEGIVDEFGVLLGESDTLMDAFGHGQLGGVSHLLANALQEKAQLSCRAIELNLPQRCASHFVSKTDQEEAITLGTIAVEKALAGQSQQMVCMIRIPGEKYQIEYVLHPVKEIANGVKRVPLSMIHPDGNQITPLFNEYASPLIAGEIPLVYQDGLIRFF